jgi:DNA-binding transcriptional MerR regulator
VPERYDVSQVCAATGATPVQLRRFEKLGLLVPHRRVWPPWRARVEYTEDQIEVLRWLLQRMETEPNP